MCAEIIHEIHDAILNIAELTAKQTRTHSSFCGQAGTHREQGQFQTGAAPRGERRSGGRGGTCPSRSSSDVAGTITSAGTQTSRDPDIVSTDDEARAERLRTSAVAQVELTGLRAQLETLTAQINVSTEWRRREVEGSKRTYAMAIAAHGTSALHARLLWSEVHELEEALEEAGATLARERREHRTSVASRDAEIAELRAQISQQVRLQPAAPPSS